MVLISLDDCGPSPGRQRFRIQCFEVRASNGIDRSWEESQDVISNHFSVSARSCHSAVAIAGCHQFVA
jgi:hypothetical protein